MRCRESIKYKEQKTRREEEGAVQGQRAAERRQTRWMDEVCDTERKQNREVEMEQWEVR